MTDDARVVAAVLAERASCIDAVAGVDPLDAVADWEYAEDIAHAVLNRAANAIHRRPAPDTDALDRALRACAEKAFQMACPGVTPEWDIQAAIAAGRAALGGGGE